MPRNGWTEWTGICNNLSHFDFHSHDNFLTKKSYIKQLVYEFEKRNLNVSWNCSSRIDQLDDEFIRILKLSGCTYIDCGPESGSLRVRKLINKDINYKNTVTNINKLLHNNIEVAVNFMFGFPTETLEEIEETFEQACRCVGSNADIVFCFLSPIKGTKIYEQFKHLLVNKTEEHIHDFTDTRANFLYGTDKLREEHPYFKNQAKMFSNGKEYDAVIEKIRRTDSVHIFIHLSKLLLALKQNFNIDIYKSKAALSTFPYSEDLFKFALSHAKEKSISAESVATVLYEALSKQQNNTPENDFQDITLLILLEQIINKKNLCLPGWAIIQQNAYNCFFKGFADSDTYFGLFAIDKFQLCSAFRVNAYNTLFLEFHDNHSQDRILTGITIDRKQNRRVACYKSRINESETKLRQHLEKMLEGKAYA